jgi:hypothetical protein
MLTSGVKKVLNPNDLIAQFHQVAADNRPTFAGADDVEAARNRLLVAIDQLDERVNSALKSNSVHEWTSYAALVLLLLVLTILVPFGLVAERYWVAIVGAGGPFALVWIVLGRLKALRDNNVALRLMLLRYRPRATVCDNLSCLDAVAREIEETLRELSGTA